jgi:hypothetical protein
LWLEDKLQPLDVLGFIKGLTISCLEIAWIDKHQHKTYPADAVGIHLLHLDEDIFRIPLSLAIQMQTL